MAEIIKDTKSIEHGLDRRTTVVRSGDSCYYIDSVFVLDHRESPVFETMVFECDPKGKVFNWGEDKYCRQYDTVTDMLLHHDELVNSFESFIN